MKRVGFLITPDEGWMGGVNYFKNLLFAIRSFPEDIEIIVYLGKNTPEKFKIIFQDLCSVKEASFLDRRSFSWFLWRATKRIFKSDFLLDIFLAKEKLDIVSHSSVWGLRNSKCINWIPDFQHIHLPEMFSSKEIQSRNIEYGQMANKSDAIILSSYDAAKDFKRFAPGEKTKARVLQFVAQPNESIFNSDITYFDNLRNKYKLPHKFFFLPNQFWKHKNHHVALSALKELKDNGVDVCLVCTGSMNDYRNKQHIEELVQFIDKHNLNVRLLGIIEYQDVIGLMKSSVAVINPSRFEGWSSSVEECKAIGKRIILSNLDVHQEQNPENGIFFDPGDAVALAHILKDLWYDDSPNTELPEKELRARLLARTHEFASEFQMICRGYPHLEKKPIDLSLRNCRKQGGTRLKKQDTPSPLVSVIIATYNSSKFLESTLESIFSQTLKSFEVIVVDGGSTDGTLSILNKYNDKISYWVSENDKGISDAFNKGVAYSNGEYINFQGDGDGFVSTSSLEEIMKEAGSRPMFISGRIRRINLLGDTLYVSPFINKFRKKSLLFKMSLPHQGLFTHISIFEKNGLFDIYNTYCMDYDHLLRIYHSFPDVVTSPIIVANWRADGLGEGKEKEIFKEYDYIKRKNRVAHPFILFFLNMWIHLKCNVKKYLRRYLIRFKES